MITLAEIHHARILIVDDQEANISLLERTLAGAGYKDIRSTRDPRTVCDLHSRTPFDLILLDLVMPGMDGFQVMEALKAVEGAVELVLEAGFGAVHGFDGTARIGGAAVSEGSAGGYAEG